MKRTKLIMLAIFSLFVISAFAQSINEAGEAFNQAIQFSKDGKYTEALDAYQQTIDICSQLGEEGADLKSKAESQLATAYYNIAKNFYEEKQYTDAISNFKLAAQWADQTGEEKTADASQTYLAGLYTAIGNSAYKKDDYEKAIEDYNMAISYKPDYFKAYYGKGITYKKQENIAEMKEALDKVIELAPADDKTGEKASSIISTTYLNEGAVALQKADYDGAIDNLNISLKYDNAAPLTHYYLALAFNGKKDWDNAIVSANKAIELGYENVGDAWFAIGQANEGKGDTAAACDAYKKVTDGPNVQAAKYQAETVLKCN